jgi:hypothetical protein
MSVVNKDDILQNFLKSGLLRGVQAICELINISRWIETNDGCPDIGVIAC